TGGELLANTPEMSRVDIGIKDRAVLLPFPQLIIQYHFCRTLTQSVFAASFIMISCLGKVGLHGLLHPLSLHDSLVHVYRVNWRTTDTYHHVIERDMEIANH